MYTACFIWILKAFCNICIIGPVESQPLKTLKKTRQTRPRFWVEKSHPIRWMLVGYIPPTSPSSQVQTLLLLSCLKTNKQRKPVGPPPNKTYIHPRSFTSKNNNNAATEGTNSWLPRWHTRTWRQWEGKNLSNRQIFGWCFRSSRFCLFERWGFFSTTCVDEQIWFLSTFLDAHQFGQKNRSLLWVPLFLMTKQRVSSIVLSS